MFFKFSKFDTQSIGNKNIIILAIFLFILFLLLQGGISQYKQIQQEKENFKNFETAKVKQFVYWVQYGDYGLRILFYPSQFISFYDAGPVPNYLTANIDTFERNIVYKPLMGRNALSVFIKEYMNFSGFLLLFGSLISLYFGYFIFKHHEWLLFLEGITGSRKKLFICLILSRVLILLVFCFILAGISMILFLINGLSIDGNFLILFTGIFFMLLFFQGVGFFLGAIVKNKSAGALLVIIWITFIFLLPWGISKLVYTHSDDVISPYKVEAEKQKAFMEYEKSSLEKGGKFNQSKRGTDIEKEMFLYFWNNGFKRAMDFDLKMLESIKTEISLYQNIAGLCPSTFFQSFCSELSSTGFNSLVGFHEYSQKMKKDFVWFFAGNYILSTKKHIVSFIKSDENIFYGKNTLPSNTGFGFVVCLLWLVLSFSGAWVGFNRILDGRSRLEINMEGLKPNRTTMIMTSNPTAVIETISLILRYQRKQFLVVPCPGSIPGDIRIDSFFSFSNQSVPKILKSFSRLTFNSLSLEEKGTVITEILKIKKTTTGVDYIIFSGFLSGLSDSFLNYFAKSLKEIKTGCKVIYISNSLLVNQLIGDDILTIPTKPGDIFTLIP